ncbi:MAG: hypothetical protein HS105_10375 [Chloracidobacterium sp.]|nr:hypothetical protein [Chloracidobacterium sp.]MCC6826470.1 hypothetical protein [Acidobacteriota bacterium]MCO5333661.1 hypothetical protein [Pyrinomonadaceae bacterium]
MIELADFYNDGTGWTCRHCARELAAEDDPTAHSRFYREGEMETKIFKLSSVGLAKWLDPERETLICPRCGVTERVNRS